MDDADYLLDDSPSPLLYGDAGHLSQDDEFEELARQLEAEQSLAGLVLNDPRVQRSAGNTPTTWSQIIEQVAPPRRKRKKKGKLPPVGAKGFGAGVLFALAQNQDIVNARTPDEAHTSIVSELAKMANRPVLGALPSGAPMPPPSPPQPSWFARHRCWIGAGVLVAGLGAIYFATRGRSA